jgi:hypothetical protein
MKPLPLSATRAPSSSFQLAVPIGLQLSRFLPSNNVIHPASDCAAASRGDDTDNRPMPQINKDVAMIAQRFIVLPPVADCFVFEFANRSIPACSDQF